MRVLLVEDEPDLNNVLSKQLKSDGYTVDSCYDGEEASDYLEYCEYDVVILDIMLPKKDGLTLLSEIRNADITVPVILLTSKDGIDDRIKGLDKGADDYLTKPFSYAELSARLRALLRRKFGNTTNKFEIADLTLDVESHSVNRGGKQIDLSAKEFSVLECLIRNKGMVLTRDQIEQDSWDISFEGGSNVVDVYIRYLRKKIDEGFDMKLIHTIRGTGYVMRINE